MKKPIRLFYQGYCKAKSYRIPLLFKTKKNSLLAICDRRKNGPEDWGDISLVLRRREKNCFFGEMIKVIDLPKNYLQDRFAFTIDCSIVQSNKTGRIFLFTTMFPRGRGFSESEQTRGYVEINNKNYLGIKDAFGKSYYLNQGLIYKLNGENTGYEVVVDDGQAFSKLGNYYKDGKYSGNIFLGDGNYQTDKTSYIFMVYSDDDGRTWTGPRDLNPMIKKDYMKFLGISPSKGVYLKEGRMIIPAYFTNEFNKQSSCLLGSDDEGESWELFAIANDGRRIGEKKLDFLSDFDEKFQLGESSIVALDDGTIKTFNRNYFHGLPNRILVASSIDRGKNFQDKITELGVSSQSWCQNSSLAIKYKGEEYVLISHPGSFNTWERKKGCIDLFKYEKGKLVHKNRKTIYKGHFQYSSLEMIDEERLGVFYEKVTIKKGERFELLYKEFDLSYIFS